MKTRMMALMLFLVGVTSSLFAKKDDTVVVVKNHKVLLVERRGNVSQKLFMMGMQGEFFLYPKNKLRTRHNREVVTVE